MATVLREICLCFCSETNNGIGPWFEGLSPPSTDLSKLQNFLTDSEEDRGTHRGNKEGPKEMCRLFNQEGGEKGRDGFPLLRGSLRLIANI